MNNGDDKDDTRFFVLHGIFHTKDDQEINDVWRILHRDETLVDDAGRRVTVILDEVEDNQLREIKSVIR